MSKYYSQSKGTEVEIKDMPTPHLRAAFAKLLLELVRSRTLDRPNGVDVLMDLHDECSERWDREYEALKAAQEPA
jgi:hypothetical protein